MATQSPPSLKYMTMDQAKELARRLYYQLGKLAEARAESVQFMTDEFNAHSIIVGYMNKPMMSDENIVVYIKNRLGLED